MAGDIQNQKEEYERMKWDLQRRIQEMEGEMTVQREVNTHTYTYTWDVRTHAFFLIRPWSNIDLWFTAVNQTILASAASP